MNLMDIFQRLWFLSPLLWLLSAFLWMVRGRLSPGSVLGGIGFLFLFAAGISRGIRLGYEFYGDLDIPLLHEVNREIVSFTPFLFLAGQLLVITGLAVSRLRSGDTAPAGGAYGTRPATPQAGYAEQPFHQADASTPGRPFPHPEMGPYTPPDRPGWGLAGAWIATSLLAWALSLVFLGLMVSARNCTSDAERREVAGAMGISILFLVPAAILFFVWLHRAWSAVPPEYRSTSPGRAVGYLFIPLFNLYWIFRAIPGLSASTRRAQLALDPGAPGSAACGMGIAAAIVSIIPYVNILSWFLILAWVILANRDRNRLLRARLA